MRIHEHYSLLQHNTFRIAASARWFAEYDSVADLQELLNDGLLKEHSFFHIGAGSNILFTGDYPGVILHSAIRFIEMRGETEEEVFIRTGAGVAWDDVVAYAVENGWGGMENLSWIPGEVGASAVQNIGAYGAEVCQVIDRVETVDTTNGNIRVFAPEECRYGYRSSIFKNELKGRYIVTAVCYRLRKVPVFNLSYGRLDQVVRHPVTLESVRQAVIAVRREKLPDPSVTGNAGSFFLNPVIPETRFRELQTAWPDMPWYAAGPGQVNIPAAWLIENAGWKGKSYRGAAVHDKQPLVLINKNGAMPADIVELAQQVVYAVREKFGIGITPEVNYI